MQGFTSILGQLSGLECDIPLVKSYIAKFAAQAVSLDVVSLVELSEPLEGGRHYPLFLLCLQQLHKARDRKWLVTAFNDSKIDLLTMLPGRHMSHGNLHMELVLVQTLHLAIQIVQ